jgi:hypothetical protein
MNDQEEAFETVLSWAGRAPPRALLVATLLGDVAIKRGYIATNELRIAFSMADEIIAYGKEHPP